MYGYIEHNMNKLWKYEIVYNNEMFSVHKGDIYFSGPINLLLGLSEVLIIILFPV
jgi:hypothetical protein